MRDMNKSTFWVSILSIMLETKDMVKRSKKPLQWIRKDHLKEQKKKKKENEGFANRNQEEENNYKIYITHLSTVATTKKNKSSMSSDKEKESPDLLLDELQLLAKL